MDAEATVDIFDGQIFLSGKVYATYFPGLSTVMLLPRAGHFFIMPVQSSAAGGLLIKVINKDGDRLVYAVDIFRNFEIETAEKISCPVVWRSEEAALMIKHYWPQLDRESVI